MLEIALVSREFHPFGGGGIGTYSNALARTLTSIGAVTVITTARHEAAHRRLDRAGDPRLPPQVRFVFLQEPKQSEIGSYYSFSHLWSARVLEGLKLAFPDGGPDLVEFQDYQAEGMVTLQALQTHDPALRRTTACVRVNMTEELCSVLDGHLGRDYDGAVTHDLERFCLRHADHLLWAGGDIHATYERFFGRGLASAVRVRHPLHLDGVPPRRPALPVVGCPLRLLYLGRLERRKGVQELLQAATALEGDRWRLTLVGEDTPTASLRGSMRRHLELMAAGDSRVELRGPVPRSEVGALISQHDLLVVPSSWECWPAVALEAMAQDRPVLATPTGGMIEIVKPGHSGWLSDACGARALHHALRHLVGHPEEVHALIASGEVSRHARTLVRPEPIAERYRVLATGGPPRATTTRDPAQLVSIVIPYHDLPGYVEEAVKSALAQTHRPVEVLLVNDGSFGARDAVLADLTARYPIKILHQPNSGLGAARNAGIAQCSGRYVLPLDADNILEPEFVARAVSALEANPLLACVTSWSTYVDERGALLNGATIGYQPLGNELDLLESENVAGDACAVIRRSVFDIGHTYSVELPAYEDWLLYRDLRRAGLYAGVIPERLMRYRHRNGSMIRQVGIRHRARLEEEISAREIESAVRWVADRPSTPARAQTPDVSAGGLPARNREEPGDAHRLRLANEELRLANLRLGSERLGVYGSAATTTMLGRQPMAVARVRSALARAQEIYRTAGVRTLLRVALRRLWRTLRH